MLLKFVGLLLCRVSNNFILILLEKPKETKMDHRPSTRRNQKNRDISFAKHQSDQQAPQTTYNRIMIDNNLLLQNNTRMYHKSTHLNPKTTKSSLSSKNDNLNRKVNEKHLRVSKKVYHTISSIPSMVVTSFRSNDDFCRNPPQNHDDIFRINYKQNSPLNLKKQLITTIMMMILVFMGSVSWIDATGLPASLSALAAYGSTPLMMAPRPTPFAPDYRPECDLILPASLSTLAAEHLAAHDDGPGDLGPSIGGSGGGLSSLTDHLNPHSLQDEEEPLSYYFPAPPAITPTSGYDNFYSTAAAAAASASSTSSIVEPILQNYLLGITGKRQQHSIRKRSAYMPGGHICISYRDIDHAVQKAKMQMGMFSIPMEVKQLNSDYPKPTHVAKVGELLVAASSILAKMYGLNKEAIVYGLPRVDTTNTVIRDMCPTFLKPVKCEISKYRTLSGMCNNLEYPSWGSTRSAMLRYLPPDYADGLTMPRIAKSGGPLPPPRVVSFVLHQQDENDYDHEVTYLVIAWGQMVDHDLTFASMPKDSQDKTVKCCKYAPQLRHPSCYPIQVPNNDPYYKFYPKKCMDFVRSTAGVKPNCPLGPRHQINVVSSYLDGDIIYGHSLSTSKRIREFQGGRLKSTKAHQAMGLKDLLPLKTQNADQGCERTGHGPNSYCFDTGDDRSNVQLQLTVMHTVWLRHHNQIAEVMAEVNPHWNDEKLFQETRRIVGAMIQHITYNEFLPIVVGRKAMTKHGLNLLKFGHYHGYDPKLNPGIRVEFQAAAFRFGHSIVPDTVDRYNKFHEKLESVRLASTLRQPFSLYHPGVLDSFIFGLINQPAYRVDSAMANEMTNHLFQKPGEQFGLDLAAINIVRGREMGVPGYNYMREFCGLPKIKYFTDLYGMMSNQTIRRYMELYEHVDDIDFWSAGIAEHPLMGAMVGPTFACIIAEQFAQIRRGDRFWYENGQGINKFSLEQLNEIRKVKLARILCEAADNMESVQLYPLLAAHPTSNPRVNCEELPEIDLSSWRETYMPYAGGPSVSGGLIGTDPEDYKAKSAKAKAAAA